MGNRFPGAVTKLLTLIPILVAVYYFDLPKFFTFLTTGGQGAFFAITLSLFVLGVILKRKILRARLELSRISFTWGIMFLCVAVFLFVYGSFSTNTVWYHYESLYVLIIGYTALRIGTGILRALAPLLMTLAFAFPLTVFFAGLNDRLVIIFLSSDLIFVLFLVFVGLRVKTMIIPFVIVSLGILAWYISPFPVRGHPVDIVLLIPVPLLVLLVPRIRRFASLPSGAPGLTCSGHHPLRDGFCSICGLRVARAKTTENFGLWGFLAVLAVAALLILTTIPVLSLIGGVPYDAYYTPHGHSGTITPSTPAGWQINSTTVYKSYSVLSPGFATDAYAIKQVYVPIFHPETKNYTMYYELAYIAPPYSNGTFGTDIPGWNRSSNVDEQLGPFQGHLTTYVTSNRVMLAYQGATSMVFLNDGTFEQFSVGLGFIREFKNSNASSDTAQFLGDLNALWLPAIKADVSLSTWTNFLHGLDQGGSSVSEFALLVSSMGVILWLGYRASLSDDRLDRFLTLASTQSEEDWSLISRLLKRPRYTGTGLELVPDIDPGAASGTEALDWTLQELENKHLVRRSLVERGADIVSVWRAAL